MAANDEDRFIRERRLQVSRMHLSNMTVREIAKQLDVHYSTISRDIKAIHDEWQAETFRNVDHVLKRELMKIDAMERDAHLVMSGQLRPPPPDPTTGERTIFVGNLVETGGYILKLMERRAKLLGLDRPERSVAALTEVASNDDTDELADVYRLLDRLALTGEAPGSVEALAAGEAAETEV